MAEAGFCVAVAVGTALGAGLGATTEATDGTPGLFGLPGTCTTDEEGVGAVPDGVPGGVTVGVTAEGVGFAGATLVTVAAVGE
jgi:hypothetical protein